MAQFVLYRYRPGHPELTPEDCPTWLAILLWHAVLVYGPVPLPAGAGWGQGAL